MKKNTLEIEIDYGFKLIALVSAMSPHALAWWLEKNLKLPLKQTEPLGISLKKGLAESFFPVFYNLDEEERYQRWTLVGNKSGNGFLISEQKMVDYYLKIEGDIDRNEYLAVLTKLKEIPGLVHYFDTKPEQFNRKENLIVL